MTVITKDGREKKRRIKVGSPFADTMQQRAAFDNVFWFRVFVNGKEIKCPVESPPLIEKGMVILLIHEDIKYESPRNSPSTGS